MSAHRQGQHDSNGPPVGHPQSTSSNRATSTSSPASPALSNDHAGLGKIDLGIQRMQRLMLFLPPLQTPAIHLAGTNGKGSVSIILESCFRQAGVSVGRYNSPHLIEPRDAIAIDGSPPSAQAYEHAMQTVQSISKEQEIEATTFEIATAAAFHLINEARVDVMVIECGMGGETDATNVIPPQLVLASGLTCVGLDHTSFLGDTVEAITQVKAGICVRDGLLVVGPQVYPTVHSVASQVAQQRGARLVTCHPAQSDLSDGRVEVNLGDFQKPPPTRFSLDTASGTRIDGTLSLVGDHQLDNVSTAINILTEIARDRRALSIQPKLAQVVQDAITRGVSLAEWPGRCSFVYYKPHGRTGRGFPVLVDGAHNADSATRLRAYIDTLEITSDAGPIGNVTWIIGLSDSTKSGKSIESVLDPLLRSGDRVYPTMFSPVESMPWVQPVPTDGETGLGMAAGKIVGRDQVVMVPTKTSGTESLEEILERISDKSSEDRGLIVLAGSLYLVADLYRLLGSR